MYKAPLFTAKARVQAYALKTHPRMTSIFPSFGMFYTNWVGSYPPTCASSPLMLRFPRHAAPFACSQTKDCASADSLCSEMLLIDEVNGGG